MIISTNPDKLKDSIRISFMDSNGNRVYPNAVRYTVFDSSGIRVSGSRQTPIKNIPKGIFYSPWVPSKPGSYRIVWEYELCCGHMKSVDSQFLAVDPKSGGCLPERDYLPLLSNQYTIPIEINENIFPIHFRDAFGSDFDVFSIDYSLIDACGDTIQTWTSATRYSAGFYFASPNVTYSGDFILRWKYQITSSDPVETKDFYFSALDLCTPPESIDPNGNIIIPDPCSSNSGDPAGMCGCGCSNV